MSSNASLVKKKGTQGTHLKHFRGLLLNPTDRKTLVISVFQKNRKNKTRNI